MKGEKTIDDKPFRYGGISHDYDRTSEEWAELIPEMRRCYICGGKMQNIYAPSGTLLKKTYPYIGLFRINFYETMEDTPNCNTCGKQTNCAIVPQHGQQVRYNCAFYEAEAKKPQDEKASY